MFLLCYILDSDSNFLPLSFIHLLFILNGGEKKTNDNKNLESMRSMFMSAPLMSSSEGGPTQEMI